jgi:hypothetical protein
MFVQAEDLLPEETGDKKGAGQRQNVVVIPLTPTSAFGRTSGESRIK